MSSDQNHNNSNENTRNITEDLNQAVHSAGSNPSTTSSNQLGGFSSTMSTAELQSSYQAIDPWFLYGGNIAAACQATNAVVEVHQRTRDDTKTVDDDDKRKQRANSRLTAWQSRERKRIEFEVLQEREAELKGRNLELLQENQKLKMIIASFKSNAALSRDNIATTDQQHDHDVLRLQDKGISTTSSLHTSRQLPINLEDIQHLSLPFQNRTELSSTNSFRIPATNAPFTQAGSTPSVQIPETRGNRDLMFSLAQDSMAGISPFSNSLEFGSTREANARMIQSSINDDGSSLTRGMPQQVRGDVGGYAALGMNPGGTSSSFLYNTNDMLAPTIFAPLFRGDSNPDQSTSTAVNSHLNERTGQNSNHHLLFGSSLPFLSTLGGQGAGASSFSANLSSYLRSASMAEEKVDVPLFRAIRTARSQAQQVPESQGQKRKRTQQQGKEDGNQTPQGEDVASEYTRKHPFALLPSTTGENVGLIGSKVYTGSDVHGSELLFSDDNVAGIPSFALRDALVPATSDANVQNDQGDEP
jgi:hypothetical protein